MQKKFAKYASEDQKRAMMTFINLMETDPQYAKALINHIGKNEGTINAATLR
jgi:Mn-containing catalase